MYSGELSAVPDMLNPQVENIAAHKATEFMNEVQRIFLALQEPGVRDAATLAGQVMAVMELPKLYPSDTVLAAAMELERLSRSLDHHSQETALSLVRCLRRGALRTEGDI